MSRNQTSASRRRRWPFRASHGLALLFAAALAAWMLSGDIIVGGGTKPPETPSHAAAETTAPKTHTPQAKPFRVRARLFHAQPRPETLTIRARTTPRYSVLVKAETAGRVLETPVAKGAFVEAGTVLCRLDMGSREARLAQARAQLAQAEANLQAAEKLGRKGYSPELKRTAEKARRDAAKAAVADILLDISRVKIRAPFAGIVAERLAETGDFLAIGQPCARLVSLDPLLVTGQVSERNVGRLKLGMTGKVRLVTGQEAQGTLRFISPTADPRTHTFRIELAVPNPKHQLRAGITARIFLDLPAKPAHFLSPGLLTLDDRGRIGVRTVSAKGEVQFLPVSLLGQTAKGVWVAGLPEEVTIITVGQDYVVAGQKVDVFLETTPATAAVNGGKDGRS